MNQIREFPRTWFAYECLDGGPDHDVVVDVRAKVGDPPAVVCPLCGRPMVFGGRWSDEDDVDRNAGACLAKLRAEVAFLRHGSQCQATPSCGVADDGVELVAICAVGSELLRQLVEIDNVNTAG